MSLGIYRKVSSNPFTWSTCGFSASFGTRGLSRFCSSTCSPLAFAVKHGFSVDVAGNLHQNKLGSKIKNYSHAKKLPIL